MKLAQFRRYEGLRQKQFAAQLQVALTTLARYETGDRIPEPSIMRRIYARTNGLVSANDFYDLGGA